MKKMLDESSFENTKKKRIRGPFIFFHDELNYDYKQDYQEQAGIPSDKQVEMLYPEYIADIEKIIPKVNKMVSDYKSELGK